MCGMREDSNLREKFEKQQQHQITGKAMFVVLRKSRYDINKISDFNAISAYSPL